MRGKAPQNTLMRARSEIVGRGTLPWAQMPNVFDMGCDCQPATAAVATARLVPRRFLFAVFRRPARRFVAGTRCIENSAGPATR